MCHEYNIAINDAGFDLDFWLQEALQIYLGTLHGINNSSSPHKYAKIEECRGRVCEPRRGKLYFSFAFCNELFVIFQTYFNPRHSGAGCTW